MPLFLILSCKDDDQNETDLAVDYLEQFRTCQNMPLNDDRLIAEILPGHWELVHVFYGWRGEPEELPEVNLSFDQDLVMNFESPDGIWNRQISVQDGRIFWMTTDYIPVIQQLNVFCSDIMGFDYSPADGNRYIFVKK